MAKLLDIVTVPNPELRKKSQDLDPAKIKSTEIQNLCADMSRTMIEKDGVGLAAPQIGKKLRIIVVNTKDGPVCMINPKLRKLSWRKEWGEEGCLSVPNTYGQVNRHKKAICNFLDINGNKQEQCAEGLLARILQHEIDHLDGILFVDKAKKIREIK